MEEELKNNEIQDNITEVDPNEKDKSFNEMLKLLLANAKKQKRPIEEVINDFISDLRNNGREGYEKKIKNISLIDFSEETLKACRDYMSRRLKFYKQQANQNKKKLEAEQKKLQKKQTEKNWKRVEESINEDALSGEKGTKIEIIQKMLSDINEGESQYSNNKEKEYMLKKLKDMLDRENKRETDRKKQEEKTKIAQETDKRKAEQAMNKIQEIVEREYEAGNIKNKGNYLTLIKNAINGENKDIDLNIKPEKGVKDQLLQMIDDRIKVEKDELYYEQVRSFTDDFQFLSAEEMRLKGKSGRMTKFTDEESAERYYALLAKIQKGEDEYLRITQLLNKKINEIDKKILSGRKEVIDREKEIRELGNIR